MSWKKFGLALLYPHWAVMILLLPISVVALVLALVFLSPASVWAIVAYLLSFYELLVLCFRLPRLVKFWRNFKQSNQFLQRWSSDVRLRMNASLYGSLVWNLAFGILQFGLGIFYRSFWFYTLAGYYILLGLMRFFLLKYTRKYQANEVTAVEIKKYIASGWLLLLMNLTLAVMVFLIVYWDATFQHHMITTIAMATYTFVTFTFAIINLIRYRKYQSPVYSSAKIITLISACVSMLTLETTMLTTFGTTESPLFRQILLAITGAVVIIFAIAMALFMIIKGHRQLKKVVQN